MSNLTTPERIEQRVRRSKRIVFLRSDFAGLGSYAPVGRALRLMVKKGVLAKVGYGIYVKARPSVLTGNPVPCARLMDIALEVMARLGVEADVGKAMRNHRDGLSTQVPMAAVIDTGNSRVSRKITVGMRTIIYECDLHGRAR